MSGDCDKCEELLQGFLDRELTDADVEKLLEVRFGDHSDEAVTTIAGLLSHAMGKVPSPSDKIDLEGFRFEVLEANQRKVLRLRARRLATKPGVSFSSWL